MTASAASVRLEPWTEEDLALLHRMNTPEMTEHLGGVESAERLARRHRLFLDINRLGLGARSRIVLLPEEVVVGSIGYSERDWEGEAVYEMGWKVLSGFQGQGIARAAGEAAVADARARGRLRHLHAFPAAGHTASNGLCARLGFTLLGTVEFEFPPGTFKPSHNWRLDLRA